MNLISSDEKKEFKLSNARNIQQAIFDNTNLSILKTCYEWFISSKNIKKKFIEVNDSYFNF